MVLAIMGISRHPVPRWIARVYTDVFRGLPAILTILLIGLGFGPVVRQMTGSTNPYPLGIAALSLMAAAYIGEIFRSGIQSVEKGQLEASRALGFGYGASMRLVVVPQGIRRVLPALVNQFISLIKDSSLVYLLGLLASQREIFRIGNDAAVATGQPLAAGGRRPALPGPDHSADPPGQLHRQPAAHRAVRRRRQPDRTTRRRRRREGSPAMSEFASGIADRQELCTCPSGPTMCCAASTCTSRRAPRPP